MSFKIFSLDLDMQKWKIARTINRAKVEERIEKMEK